MISLKKNTDSSHVPYLKLLDPGACSPSTGDPANSPAPTSQRPCSWKLSCCTKGQQPLLLYNPPMGKGHLSPTGCSRCWTKTKTPEIHPQSAKNKNVKKSWMENNKGFLLTNSDATWRQHGWVRKMLPLWEFGIEPWLEAGLSKVNKPRRNICILYSGWIYRETKLWIC